MITVPHLKIFTVFSSLQLLIDAQDKAAASFSQKAFDGEKYVWDIAHGNKGSQTPGYLIFTAPYRLCEKGCNNTSNFIMEFPLFIGRKGNEMYKRLYDRDYKKIYSSRPNAPFKRKTTKMTMTPCPTQTFKIKKVATKKPLENTSKKSGSNDKLVTTIKIPQHDGDKRRFTGDITESDNYNHNRVTASDTPGNDSNKPVTASDQSKYDNDKRVTASGKPTYDNDKRVTASDKPKYDNDKRVTASVTPKYDNDKRVTASDKSKYDNDKRVTASDKPKYDNDNRATTNHIPAYDSRNPVTGSDKPEYNKITRVTASELPAYDNEIPVTNSDKPKYDNAKPVTVSDIPAYDNNKPVTASVIPKTDSGRNVSISDKSVFINDKTNPNEPEIISTADDTKSTDCPKILPGECVKKNKKKSLDVANYIIRTNDFYDILMSDYEELE